MGSDNVQLKWQDILELANNYRANRIEFWINEVLFSLQWWILLITSIGFIVIWIVILDRTMVIEIVTYGLMVAIIANFADMTGISFSLWGYPYNLMHSPEIIEVHNVMMPIIYMILYQYFRKWKSFIIAHAIKALIFAVVL